VESPDCPSLGFVGRPGISRRFYDETVSVWSRSKQQQPSFVPP
jgi:hypothetical protein